MGGSLSQLTSRCRDHNSARRASSARLSFSSFSSSWQCSETTLQPGEDQSGQLTLRAPHQVLDELLEGWEVAGPLLLPVPVLDDPLDVTEGVPGGHVRFVGHVQFILSQILEAGGS